MEYPPITPMLLQGVVVGRRSVQTFGSTFLGLKIAMKDESSPKGLKIAFVNHHNG